MKTRHALALAGLTLASVTLVADPVDAARAPWGQRVVELHAVLDAAALELAGSGEVIVSVTFDDPDYLIRTDHCTVRVILAAPEGAVEFHTVAIPGPNQFSARAKSPLCE